MNHTSDFDNLNSRSLFDTDLGGLFRDKTLQHASFAQNDFPFAQRRERIDSEDFVLPPSLSVRKDTDFFVAEFQVPKVTAADEGHTRRKSSTVADSNLLELEVSLREVHFQPFQPGRLRRCHFSQPPSPPVETHWTLRKFGARSLSERIPLNKRPKDILSARFAFRPHQAQRLADH